MFDQRRPHGDKGVYEGTSMPSLHLAIEYWEFNVKEFLDIRKIKSLGDCIKTSFSSEDPKHALYNSPNESHKV